MESEIDSLIIRTVGVYGVERAKKNFAKQVINGLFSGKKVYVPSDQKVNPILSTDLAKLTIKLAEKESGLWHVAGNTCLTKYEFAVKIAESFGLESMVVPKVSKDMKQKALRPENGCLDCTQLRRANYEVPDLDGGLSHFLSMEFNG